MKIIKDKIDGNITLNEDTKLHGIIAGAATVSQNVLLHLHGVVAGNLTLEPDSHVVLHGIASGDVINNGGFLEVFGIVNGRVIRNAGNTEIAQKAVINGGVI